MEKEPENDIIDKKGCEEQLIALKTMISKKESDLSQREETLQNKELDLSKREIDAQNNFPKLFENKFSESIEQLKNRGNSYTSEWKNLEAEKHKLCDREREIQKDEIERDQGYADKKSQLKKELISLKEKHQKELVDELENERERRLEEINREVKSIRGSLEQNKEELDTRQMELKTQEDTLNFNERQINAQQSSLQERMQCIDKEVNKKIEARQQSFEVEKQSLEVEINRLRNSISSSSDLIGSFEELKRKLGNEAPEAVLLKLKTHEETIKNLEQELIDRPTKEMQLEFDRLNQEKEQLDDACNRLSDENVELKEIENTKEQLELEHTRLSNKNKTLVQLHDSIGADNNRLHDELKRLQASYEREADRDARIRDIETPYIIDLPRINSKQDISEIEWLDSINNSFEEYGFKFPRRILYAFHTALKTSEWSPLTVLAGVSGTGKSELPRLYSHFGGINFLSLSVQPNWDSQESMLGFFNSIDNKFDAQPVLRLLTQSQNGSKIKRIKNNKKKAEEDQKIEYIEEDYPGLKDSVSIILMDEMNLAHVELYFAEFLSKLELRRGTRGDNIPTLDIKLGAGIKPYKLPLGRNVLWAGTMNQDETTKSLSDKVLDRGIVINFPRPTSFERRKKTQASGQPRVFTVKGNMGRLVEKRNYI
ncbi:MAG: chromosome partitioning protein ParA [Gammaproteobacteria bacterium]|nr:chromosome partitioning protein ParA [Gammaproteobacteria bacterium]